MPANIVDPARHYSSMFWTWVRNVLYLALPSTELLSEEKFLVSTHAAIRKTTWIEHLTVIAYGLDHALVCLLFAMW